MSHQTQTMKILFLTYHGFDPASGISKKMLAQIKGLRQNGHEVHVCSYDYASNGHLCRMIDGQIIKDYGKGALAGIRQRMSYGCIADFCLENDMDMVYARHYMNASPWLVSLFRQLRKNGIKCVTEIPTFPYDLEFRHYSLSQRFKLHIDQLFRRSLVRQMAGIVTFSDADIIFGQRTIHISNGVDLEAIPLHHRVDITKEIHLIAVAEVHSWHGFDRIIEGLGIYTQKQTHVDRPVYLHIVGDVWDSEMNGSKMAPGFAPIIEKYGIKDRVVFHGKLFGEDLNRIFNQCCFAVGSLGRHRSGITHIKTLKNREYACRGIPFIYSEYDSDFDFQPYVLKASADESPVDVQCIVDFLDNYDYVPAEIRKTVESLSWKNQMQIVIDTVRSWE